MILIQNESKSAKLQVTQLQKADSGKSVPKNLIFNVLAFLFFVCLFLLLFSSAVVFWNINC